MLEEEQQGVQWRSMHFAAAPLGLGSCLHDLAIRFVEVAPRMVVHAADASIIQMTGNG